MLKRTDPGPIENQVPWKALLTEISNGIGIITLNRPEKRNAISIMMRKEISRCLNEWKYFTAVRIVILTGSGSAFSAGFDLDEFRAPGLFKELLNSSSKYHRDILGFPKPVIAAVNGPAIGGGLDLAALCDIRICSRSATFGHPEVKFGAPPIYTPLRAIVGDGAARLLCLSGRIINSEEAYRIGLVSEIVENGELLKKGIDICRDILEAPSDTLEFIKSYFTGSDSERWLRIELDKAFKRFILPKARNGFEITRSGRPKYY
jgi:enoyl-CoA hydratase